VVLSLSPAPAGNFGEHGGAGFDIVGHPTLRIDLKCRFGSGARLGEGQRVTRKIKPAR
jgi:hypothetical protein